jgi:hypothetical protein
MAYHADFWVLAGTTSPVVALAAVVSAGSTLAALSGEKRLSARLIKGVAYFICLLNIALQAVVAQAALTSLAAGHDSVPLHATTDHVITGLFLLFVSLIGRIPAEADNAQGKARGEAQASTADDGGPEPEAT